MVSREVHTGGTAPAHTYRTRSITGSQLQILKVQASLSDINRAARTGEPVSKCKHRDSQCKHWFRAAGARGLACSSPAPPHPPPREMWKSEPGWSRPRLPLPVKAAARARHSETAKDDELLQETESARRDRLGLCPGPRSGRFTPGSRPRKSGVHTSRCCAVGWERVPAWLGLRVSHSSRGQDGGGQSTRTCVCFSFP